MPQPPPQDAAIQSFAYYMRMGYRVQLGPMVDAIAEKLAEHFAHPLCPWESEDDLIDHFFESMDLFPFTPDAYDERLVREIERRFGQSGLKDPQMHTGNQMPVVGDIEKTSLSFMLYIGMEMGNVTTIAQTLHDDFSIRDKEERARLCREIDGVVQQAYRGDVAQYFSDLKRTYAGRDDLRDKMRILHQRLESRGHTNPHQAPRPPGL